MSFMGTITASDKDLASFCFDKGANGETYLTFYQDGTSVKFHMQVCDHEKGGVARLPLPEELRKATTAEATAKAVVSGVVETALIGERRILISQNDGGSRNLAREVKDTFVKAASESPFSSVSADIKLDEPIWALGSARRHAVWATRVDGPKAAV